MARTHVIGLSSQPEYWTWCIALSAVFLVTYLVTARAARGSKQSRLALPPGPKRIPLLGNALQVYSAKTKPWLMYRDLAKEHGSNGEMVYLEVLGQPILVINSLKVAHDLLDKRGAIYSDRSVPPSVSILRLNWAFVVMNYDSRFKAYRRVFHQYYNKTQIHNYAPVLERQTLMFLRNLSSNPSDFMEATWRLLSGIIIEISYGLTDPSEVKSLRKTAQMLVETFSDCAQPGYFLVDVFPFLQWVPSWFPGAGWKRRLEEVSELTEHLLRKAFDDARERVNANPLEGAQNVAAKIIANLPPEDDPSYTQEEDIGRSIALIGYTAGGDTTTSSGHALFIAMANYPECQRLAQEELDTVIGTKRLPTLADLPDLPYIQAFIKELSRWWSVAPLGIPHTTSQDDVYEGYFIPKGTTVIANAWAIMHDPEIFDDPLEFKPERYLMRDPDTQQLRINPEVLDPESAAFGFGRRACPGRYFSNEALTLVAASIFSAFEVNAPRDHTGQPTKIEMEIIGCGVAVTPGSFKVDIEPRSPHHTTLLQQ